MQFFLDPARTHRVPRSRTASPFRPRTLLSSAGPRALLYPVLLSLLLSSVASGVLAPPAAADSLDALREQADEAREELQEATDEYTEREEQLADAQTELVGTLHELQQTELRLSELREPLTELAVSLYKQPDTGALGLVTSDEIGADLEAEAYVQKLADDRESLLDEANSLRGEQQDLTGSAQELQSYTQLERVELEDELDALRQRSEETTEELTQELEDRGLSPDAYMAGVECDADAASAASGHPNGLLPDEALCELWEEGHTLRADAAVDLIRLNERHVEEFGEDMCLTSAYRDLPNQQRVFAQTQPGFAAVPGTSNHGLGLAVDLCGGVQNFRSERWNWVEANGAEFGWYHPDWAKSSPFEPWHWEYEYG